MNDSFIRTTSILTEHFGYAPIAVVDDVINAVNQVLYTVTDAMEDFLKTRQARHLQKIEQTARDASDYQARVAELPTTKEIEIGTAKMETLLETKVDEKFDLFELDALRNVFSVPPELVEGGWFKLGHHTFDAASVSKANEDAELDREIARLEHDLFGGEESLMRQQQRLKLELNRLRRMEATVERCGSSFAFLTDRASDASRLYRDVVPLAESVQFLVNSAKGLEPQVRAAKRRRVDRVNLPASARDQYLDTVTNQAILKAGLWSGLDDEQVSLAAEFAKRERDTHDTEEQVAEVQEEVQEVHQEEDIEEVQEVPEAQQAPEQTRETQEEPQPSQSQTEHAPLQIPQQSPPPDPPSELDPDEDKENKAPQEATQTVSMEDFAAAPAQAETQDLLASDVALSSDPLISSDPLVHSEGELEMFEVSVD
ncbi:Kinetochore-associated protein [Yarrowia sp. B02]|nr:Kinetochore-associated protein [Yarrowia sp. B02]